MTKKTKKATVTVKVKKTGEIFVYCELKSDGTIYPVTFELLNSAKNLSKGFKHEMKVCAVVCHEGMIEENLEKELSQAGADKIYQVKTTVAKAEGITELCKIKNPEIFLIGATIEGRTIAPLIATYLGTGLTADCTGLETVDEKLASTRPTFGGRLMATILCKTKPQMATVRAGVFKRTNKNCQEKCDFEEFRPELKDFNGDLIKILSSEVKRTAYCALEGAKIVVGGGLGLKNKEGFTLLKRFARAIGAAYAGSRKAVDKGLIEKEFQIGQTGKTVTPDIYLAFGISGAIQHLQGVENAKKIIAVNTDKNAPIFKNADLGVVADASKTLERLINELEQGEN